MGIFVRDIINESDLELSKLIKEDTINIVFGSMNVVKEINESFKINKDKGNNKIYILIRNKYLDGVNGQPIPHDCTVKFIKNDMFGHNGMKGAPFSVSEKPKLLSNEKVNRDDSKFVKNFIKNNYKDILEYWNLPNTKNGIKRMNEIENELKLKYGVIN